MKWYCAVTVKLLFSRADSVQAFTGLAFSHAYGKSFASNPSLKNAPLQPSVPLRTRLNSSNAPRHDVRGDGSLGTEIDPEEMKVQAALAEHQKNAPKLGFPVDVRTLVQYNHGFAVMSTNSKA